MGHVYVLTIAHFLRLPSRKLCTCQYSLVSLFPGLLQDDYGSPSLAAAALVECPETQGMT